MMGVNWYHGLVDNTECPNICSVAHGGHPREIQPALLNLPIESGHPSACAEEADLLERKTECRVHACRAWEEHFSMQRARAPEWQGEGGHQPRSMGS